VGEDLTLKEAAEAFQNMANAFAVTASEAARAARAIALLVAVAREPSTIEGVCTVKDYA